MITINLYDYKRVVRDVGIQKNLFMVAGVFVISGLLAGGIGFFQWTLNAMVESELNEVKAKVAAAKPDYDAVQGMKARQKKYNEIIDGIKVLRSQQAPTTRLLEDIGQVLPNGVWLKSVGQMDLDAVMGARIPFLFIDYNQKGPKKPEGENKDIFIEIKGTAVDDQPVIHFLDQLRAFPYFDAVVLHNAKREWIETVPVQQFSIYCHFLKPEPEKS